MPVIDVISDDTFAYQHSSYFAVGGFDWNLQFNWHSVPERERKKHKHKSEAVWTPTMAGGLFSIDSAFFERLGQSGFFFIIFKGGIKNFADKILSPK